MSRLADIRFLAGTFQRVGSRMQALGLRKRLGLCLGACEARVWSWWGYRRTLSLRNAGIQGRILL